MRLLPMRNKIKHFLNKLKDTIPNLERPVLIIGIIIVSLLLSFKLEILTPWTHFPKSSSKENSYNSEIPKIKTVGDVEKEVKFFSKLVGGIGKGSPYNSEIEGIKATEDMKEQIKLYTELIERVGPEQAQEDLFKSGLPFTGQTHLLNHTAGDYLYLKYGSDGLLKCKDYFLSSCYHGFVLHVIGKGGTVKVAETLEACRKNGVQTFSQCAHAVGHGYLAYLGYKNLIEALKTCDQAAVTTEGFPLFNCYDGVFMENIWGIHDGEPSPDRWIKPEDKQYPCNDRRIDDKYLLGCWSNQPALAYQLFKGDIAKVPAVCMAIVNKEQQEMCFNGLSRQIHPLTRGDVNITFELCSLMPNAKWSNYCLAVNAASSFGMGGREIPFEICGRIPTEAKEDCYTRVFSNMSGYINNKEEFYALCDKVKDDLWREKCKALPFY